jgi:hypothetical protein
MKPVFAAAKVAPRRVVFAEGEEERVLRAIQTVLEEGLAEPVVIGRPEVVQMRIERIGLRLEPGKDFELVNPDSDPRYRPLWTDYHELMGRKGVTPEIAKQLMRSDTTLIGCMLLRHGYADALICGVTGRHATHLQHVADVIGLAPGARTFAAMNLLMLPRRHHVHLRHLRERGSGCGDHRRDHPDGRRGGAPLRPDAEGCPGISFQLRQLCVPGHDQDERGALDHRAHGPGPRGGRRDARRCGLQGGACASASITAAGSRARPTC